MLTCSFNNSYYFQILAPLFSSTAWTDRLIWPNFMFWAEKSAWKCFCLSLKPEVVPLHLTVYLQKSHRHTHTHTHTHSESIACPQLLWNRSGIGMRSDYSLLYSTKLKSKTEGHLLLNRAGFDKHSWLKRLAVAVRWTKMWISLFSWFHLKCCHYFLFCFAAISRGNYCLFRSTEFRF